MKQEALLIGYLVVFKAIHLRTFVHLLMVELESWREEF
jgi:hypothetical protein